MDIDEAATDLELRMTEDSIARQRSQVSRVVTYTGYCQNELCEAPLKGDKRFCNADCRDEHDRVTKLNSLHGRRNGNA